MVVVKYLREMKAIVLALCKQVLAQCRFLKHVLHFCETFLGQYFFLLFVPILFGVFLEQSEMVKA